MNILFLHRNYPGQFKFLAQSLASDKENNVYFITNNKTVQPLKNIKKVVYNLKRKVPDNCHQYLRFYEDSVIHGQAAAEAMIKLKEKGFMPDIIYGHTWGPTLFAKDVFPDVPLVCYFEWYYNRQDSDVDFANKTITVNESAKLKCKNAHLLIDLVNCDWGVSPTMWQKKQFPKEFQNKIQILPDGIDTNICKPNENVEFHLKDKGITLTRKNEILTYATRGMEEYRGFPEFMQVVERLQKKRPNMHTIIAGDDRVCYGRKLKDDTFKKKMLRTLDLDLDRIHFMGTLPYSEYLKLLQVSSVHVYLTYPFVLSWSLLESLSCGCVVLASDTEPVKEVIRDGYNGFLSDFYDIDKITSLADNILDKRNDFLNISVNARKTILENYELENSLKMQKEYIKSLIKIRK